MYAFISGTLKELTLETAVVEVCGIGYVVHVPKSIYTSNQNENESIFLHTCFIVREDSMKLFGFLEKDEKALFEKLISISGLGPKTALAIIGSGSEMQFQQAIQEKNISALTKIPGIGKKTAERIIVELFDSFKSVCHAKPSSSIDAVKALIGLGLKEYEAQAKVESVLKGHSKELALSEIISLSLSSTSSR